MARQQTAFIVLFLSLCSRRNGKWKGSIVFFSLLRLVGWRRVGIIREIGEASLCQNAHIPTFMSLARCPDSERERASGRESRMERLFSLSYLSRPKFRQRPKAEKGSSRVPSYSLTHRFMIRTESIPYLNQGRFSII